MFKFSETVYKFEAHYSAKLKAINTLFFDCLRIREFTSFLDYLQYPTSNYLLFTIPGTICNFEEYNNSQSSAINRYFCVQDTYCRNSIQHSPLMHYEGCNRFMQSSNGGNLVCCHQNELQEDLSIHYTNLNYLPGIRSFLSEFWWLDTSKM